MIRVRIQIVGDLLEGQERFYEGPSVREALLTAATDLVCCGHFARVRAAFRYLKSNRLYKLANIKPASAPAEKEGIPCTA